MGSHIEEVLRGHLRAAIRRRIIATEGKLVRADTTNLDDYALEELRDALPGGMRKRERLEREDVIRMTIRSLGFSRMTDGVRAAMKTVLNSCIRQGLLASQGAEIVWRA